MYACGEDTAGYGIQRENPSPRHMQMQSVGRNGSGASHVDARSKQLIEHDLFLSPVSNVDARSFGHLFVKIEPLDLYILNFRCGLAD
jgi:hypothetical protein